MASGGTRGHVRIVSSTGSALRLQQAVAFLRASAPHEDVVIVGASRGAADDVARHAAAGHGATIGWHRFSLVQLAARLAIDTLASSGRLPGSPLGAEAIASQAIFGALADRGLPHFVPVAHTPGFSRAVARTVGELRLAGVPPGDVATQGPAGLDLAGLLAHIDGELRRAGAADRATLLASATAALVDRTRLARELVMGRRVLIVDPALASEGELALVAALAQTASQALLTLQAGDADVLTHVGERCGATVETLAESPEPGLGRLRAHLFQSDLPADTSDRGSVELFSAPGEAREAVEIARRVHAEAGRGVPFDEMAVLVRAPQQYLGLLEHALARGGVPTWFDRGTRRPDPAGRAMLALLFCAEEGLSARRFSEYLSLAQVPDPQEPVIPAALVMPDDEVLAAGVTDDTAPDDPPEPPGRVTALPAWPVVDGTLRAPWKWEALLVESAVIGGRDRWITRLDGLEYEYRSRLAEIDADEPEAPRAAALRRDLEHLGHLRAFALPVIEQLDEWRESSAWWGEWLTRLEHLAPRVLRQPTRVLRVLAELRPMSGVGPVRIGEVRKVLAERLRLLAVEPPARRFGRLFVGSPDQARGRVFRVVFVPGLAERIFPQKLREDPLLLDETRERLGPALARRDRRASDERLHLQLAIGAATERLYLSYPRLDVNESRSRVPSFYALDVTRALTGRVPSHEDLQREAYDAGAATLAWPAPADPLRAIDALEHDLAILRPLFDEPDRGKVAGRARYLLELSPCLSRAVRERWSRHQVQWSEADGLLKVTAPILEPLETQRLGRRPYSLSALQHYAACPYRFLLSAIYRLAPREDVVPLQRLDPLTKGSLFHRVQAEVLRALRDRQQLPLRPATVAAAQAVLAETLSRVADDERARLAPAIRRVWDDEIAAMQRDLARWLQLMAEGTDGWVPQWFEFAFGLPGDVGRDPASLPEPVVVDGRFILRGSMDMVERHPTGALRVTDHKTGRARWPERMIVAGGEALQPLLYGLALESATGQTVHEGRLWFCTAAGEFAERSVPLTETTRRIGLEVLEIVDRAVEHAALAPYPKAGACEWCDFKVVCGAGEERRTGRKVAGRFPDLDALRGKS